MRDRCDLGSADYVIRDNRVSFVHDVLFPILTPALTRLLGMHRTTQNYFTSFLSVRLITVPVISLLGLGLMFVQFCDDPTSSRSQSSAAFKTDEPEHLVRFNNFSSTHCQAKAIFHSYRVLGSSSGAHELEHDGGIEILVAPFLDPYRRWIHTGFFPLLGDDSQLYLRISKYLE
jgi:hypothetical protein